MSFTQLVYRSVASQPLSLEALQDLLVSARQRNALEGLTGLLVVDQGRFLQWLEGPREGLERVWRSICRDPRHRDIERLRTPWRAERLFADWAMQIGTAADRPALREGLRIDPQWLRATGASAERAAALPGRVALQQLLPDAATLAHWCSAVDPGAWSRLTDTLVEAQPSLQTLYDVLLGPVSRTLGDAWLQDTADSTDLLVASGRLQALLRRIGAGPEHVQPVARTALVAAAPGETHLQGVTLAAVAFDALGWRVACCFPERAEELLAPLAEQRHHALHLALSDSLTREHRLAELAALIRAARRASANPQLQVLLSGRALAQQPGLAVFLGADGEGLFHGADGMDGTGLQALLAYAQTRRHSPANMVAQATLSDVVLQMQRRRFGIPEERAEEPGRA